MAKAKERSTARFMYVEQGKDAKEIAAKLNVSEATLSKWVNENKGAWKAERDAKLNSRSQRKENIRRVITNLTEQALEVYKLRKKAVEDDDKEQIAWCDEQSVKIADSAGKWNKNLESIETGSRITLDVYLDVMDDVFEALRLFDNKLFLQTINFQDSHIQFISSKLG